MDAGGFVILLFLLLCTLKFFHNKNKCSIKGLLKTKNYLCTLTMASKHLIMAYLPRLYLYCCFNEDSERLLGPWSPINYHLLSITELLLRGDTSPEAGQKAKQRVP